MKQIYEKKYEYNKKVGDCSIQLSSLLSFVLSVEVERKPQSIRFFVFHENWHNTGSRGDTHVPRVGPPGRQEQYDSWALQRWGRAMQVSYLPQELPGSQVRPRAHSSCSLPAHKTAEPKYSTATSHVDQHQDKVHV